MSTTIRIPDNVPVSWLQQMRELAPGTLMLASEPSEGTETQFMSKYFTYGTLAGRLSSDLSIKLMMYQISDLYDNKASLSSYITGRFSLDSSDPYIISSMTHVVSSDGRFGLLSCDGYRLSAGIRKVFDRAAATGQAVSQLVPQLSAKTTPVDRPLYNFVSSVTDAEGHVRSFGYGSFAEVVPMHIGKATKSVQKDWAVSSVTTDHGVVTGVGGVDIKAVVGPVSRVYYADYTGQ